VRVLTELLLHQDFRFNQQANPTFYRILERSNNMAQKFTPLHDRVLIRRVAEAESVRGGIIIPDSAKEKPQEGIVLAVGTGKFEKGQTIPLAVKEGDRVLFGKYAGTEIRIDLEELLIVREEEILGILSGAAKGKEKELAGSRR
jgi:chaperonin GroES